MSSSRLRLQQPTASRAHSQGELHPRYGAVTRTVRRTTSPSRASDSNWMIRAVIHGSFEVEPHHRPTTAGASSRRGATCLDRCGRATKERSGQPAGPYIFNSGLRAIDGERKVSDRDGL